MTQSIHVSVKLMGVLKDRTPQDGVDLPAGTTIEDVLTSFSIDGQSAYVCTINGSLVRDHHHLLQDGDELTVLPPVGGG